MSKTHYEWDCETIDPDSMDILDHDHRDFLRELPSREKLDIKTQQICLVKDVLGDDLDLAIRTHWYPMEDQLPMFANGDFVPKRFLKEFKNWWKGDKS